MSKLNPDLADKGKKTATHSATMFQRGGGKSKTPEGQWRSACVQYLKTVFAGHIWHIRTVGGIHQRSGIPDDIFVIRGFPVAIEFKAPNGRYKVTVKQQAEIDAFNRAGGRAGEVRTWEDLDRLIEGIPVVQLGMKITK